MLILRLAEYSDINILFSWANDREVRKNSFSSTTILFEDHQRWFQNKISSNESKIFIGTEDGQPVGTVRFDRKNRDDAEISITIAPNMRGKGFGKSILNMGIEKVIKEGFAKRLYAQTRSENLSSQAIFLYNGFMQIFTAKDKSRLTFMLNIDNNDYGNS
jgi:RimJ/RimL family protein N-acetyltransferase